MPARRCLATFRRAGVDHLVTAARAYDLAGERFGHLVVIERRGTDRHGNALWRCICDCGDYSTVRATHLLVSRGIRSCITCRPHRKRAAASTVAA